MKISRQLTTGLVTLLAVGLIGGFEVTHAQSVAPSAGANQLAPQARPIRQFLRALRQLNLSDDQKQQIKSLVSAARQSIKSEPALDLRVLANPADPNYATVLQSVKDRAAARIQHWSEVQMQIFNVLTPEQKTQLPQVLNGLQARSAQPGASAS